MARPFRGFLPFPKPRLRRIDLSGGMMLGLGGIAACAAFITYRARARRHGGPGPRRVPAGPASRANGTDPETAAPDRAAVEMPGGTLDPASDSAPVTDVGMPSYAVSGSEPRDEPWMDALRSAMETPPGHCGFDKDAWTSPMLAEYLARAHGATVPVPRIRKALKESGYRWKGTRYVPVHDGKPESR